MHGFECGMINRISCSLSSCMRALDEYMHIVNQLLFQQSSEDAGGEGGGLLRVPFKNKKMR